MELSKIQIAKLKTHNWVSWKYRMLYGIDGLMDIVEGKARRPQMPRNVTGESATVEMATYKDCVKNYNKLDTMALLLIPITWLMRHWIK